VFEVNCGPHNFSMRLIILVLLFITSLLRAQQVPDTVFNWSIEKPAFEIGKGPVIGIDKAHNNFHTLDGRFAAFGKLLRNNG